MTFAIAGVLLAIVLVLWLNRAHCKHWFEAPVILTRGTLSIIMFLVGMAVMTAIVTSHLNRESLKHERQARVAKDIASLNDRLLTKRQVAGIAQAMIALVRPTMAERNRRNLTALKTCVQSNECRKLLTTIVVQTIDPRIVIGKPSSRTRTIVIEGKPGPGGPRGPQGLPGPAGKDGRNGGNGRNGTDGSVNSSIVDGLDNRVADLEHGLQSVVARIEPLQALVARLCHVLTPTRC
jgi:hypothetical protein